MLRNRYENNFMTSPLACSSCKNKACPYIFYKNIAGQNACMYYRGKYKHPQVTSFSADWIFFQIRRDVQMMLNVVHMTVRDMLIESSLPISMRDSDNGKPTHIECKVMDIALKAYSDFLKKRKDEYEKTSRDPTTAIIALVNSIIDTMIVVEDKVVRIYSLNEELLDMVREKVLKEGYMFMVSEKGDLEDVWGEL